MDGWANVSPTTPGGVVQIGDATLYHGDCLEILDTLDGVDAVITDPPYSSGGMFRADRMLKPAAKYVNSDSQGFQQDFSGDNRDQRAFTVWAMILFGKMYRSSKAGSSICVFTDWRQLPAMTDALQGGGWIWRNIVTWWKPGIRMQRGRFSSSSEYILYGSHGQPSEGEKSPQNVLQFAPVNGDAKEHIAEKPIGLLETLVSITPPGAIILDPFMGSGTTGVACAHLGRKFVGIEIDRAYFETARTRISAAYAQGHLF